MITTGGTPRDHALNRTTSPSAPARDPVVRGVQVTPLWRKSSRSGSQSDYVKVARLAGNSGLRDSKAPDAGRLVLIAESFAALVSRVKRDELNIQGRRRSIVAPTMVGASCLSSRSIP